GTPPEQIAVVCPSVERWQAPVDTAFGSLGIPYALEGRPRLDRTAFGAALLALLRFAWLGGGRADLYAYLRSPYSGITRAAADFAEGRLRGRAVATPERVEAETERLRNGPLPALHELRAAESAVAAARRLVGSMLRAASPPAEPTAGDAQRDDLRAYEATLRLLDELEGWERLGGPILCEELASALEHATVRG